MPEIKHTFQGGKMNKDLDERLVPNGEFRDAENIQVRTSATDAIGTVQNIKGNAEVGATFIEDNTNVGAPIAVASVADEKNNKGYFFFTSQPAPILLNSQLDTIVELVTEEMVFIDSIIEQDINGNTQPVVIDRHTVINTKNEVIPESIYSSINYANPWTSFQVSDASKYRVDMTIKALAVSDIIEGQLVDLFTTYTTLGGIVTNLNAGVGAKIKHIDLDTNTITLYEEQITDMSQVLFFVFEAEPVLNFQGNQITGINVIDDLLFWTDNLTEPKKININRCKEGSVDLTTHTKLFVENPLLSTGPGNETYVSISEVSPGLENYPTNTDLLEKHLTVLRQAPRTAPTLEMSDTLREAGVEAEFEWIFNDGDNIEEPDEGDTITLSWNTFSNTDFRQGDRLDIFLSNNDGGWLQEGGMTVTFVQYVDGGGGPVNAPSANIQVTVNSVIPPIPTQLQDWTIKLKQTKPLFELKLARFGYRYKYEDGEYSAFSPFSELAFLPGEFDMVVKKAYNLGMVNTLRELIVKDFIPYKKPQDVVAVDLLYKESSKPNVYVVKTISRTLDDDWEVNTPSFVNTEEIRTGRLNVTSEMIHKVLPSNQTLRAWDNVPRYALAQEITANRLIYGNYTQGYPFNTPVSLEQTLKSDDSATMEDPQKSVKSIRSYKWGMVFGDKYGRETPVIESGYQNANSDLVESMSGDIAVPKELSSTRNFFQLKQGWDSIAVPNGVPPDWIDYVKYYVKETSNEYYNLIMDRWYWADEEKDNVWISFNSADRNKLDIESYLVLKNQHGNNDAVTDRARFKIIAIENDAPDFIKTVRRKIGSVEIYPAIMNKHGIAGDNLQTTTQTGWDPVIPNNFLTTIPADMPVGLMMNTTCQIYLKSWNETISGWGALDTSTEPVIFGVQDFSNSIFGRRIDGNIKFRIRGDNGPNKLWSSWRTIYHYRFVERPENPPSLGANGTTEINAENVAAGEIDYWEQKIELNWDSTWQNEAWMYDNFQQTFGNSSTDNLKMYFEFVEDHIDHRPQFDGKFFVKIERNLELETNVLYSDGSGGIYFNKSVGNYVRLQDPTGSFGQCNDNINTRDFWNDWTFGAPIAFAGGRGAYPFIDEAQPYYARFTNVPDGLADPNQPGWTTNSNPVFGAAAVGGAGFQGGFQDPHNVGSFTRMYISYNRLPGTGVYQDLDNDGVADVDFTGFNTNISSAQYNNQAVMISMVGPFFNKMSDNGTQFRFGVNPGQIFEVIDAGFAEGPNGGNFARNYGGAQEELGGVVPGGGASEFQIGNVLDQDNSFNEFFGGISNTGGGVGNVAGNCLPCQPNDTWDGNGACARSMLRVDFRLVNQDTNQPIWNQGLNLNVTNAFSGLNSSGGGADRRIYIVEPSDIFGSPGLKAEVGGAWETEPKDDVDLDIYYEATNAVPMRLKPDNAFDFAPFDSTWSIRRWESVTDLDTGQITQQLVDQTLTNTFNDFNEHKVANIAWLNDTPLVYLTSIDDDGNVVPHVYDIQVGGDDDEDYIVFTHSDGTQTMSLITGEYTPTSFPFSSSSSFVPSETYYPEIVIATIFDASQGNNQLFVSNAVGLYPGMYITSTNEEVDQINSNIQFGLDNASIIPNGTKIESINTDVTYQNPNWNNGNVGYQIILDFDGTVAEDWDLSTIQDYADEAGLVSGFPYVTKARVSNSLGFYQIDPEVWKYEVKLAWHNCYAFGNGIESDRIRDDFNALQIDNGVRVSTTFSGYGEERRSSGLIHSGLYNSTSEVNDLNEFNMGEKIQKDLNPAYGSIQALKTRDTDVVVFAEDKVLKVLASKDAVFNADGNPQLVATNRTLGTAVAFGGEYGISKNPESLAVDQYRMYFTDKARGAVLRLSMDGLTPISNAGMKSWFRDNLKLSESIIGSFDDVNGEYNVTLNYGTNNPIVEEPIDDIGVNIENWNYSGKTASFNEGAKGWVSFKSFIPQTGLSISNKYITARDGKIWQHYKEFEADDITAVPYSNFYGNQYEARFKVVFNDMPSTIKHFNTMNYEGSQSYIKQNLEDSEFYNLTSKEGWYVNSFKTDLQDGFVNEFIDKENKWFNRIQGKQTELANVDTSEFTVQGIGVPTAIAGDYLQPGYIFTVQNWEDDSPDAVISSTTSLTSTYED